MRERIISIIADVLDMDISAINAKTGPETCEKWDSLAQVVMISRISDELGLEVPFDKMMGIKCAGDLLALAGE